MCGNARTLIWDPQKAQKDISKLYQSEAVTTIVAGAQNFGKQEELCGEKFFLKNGEIYH